MKNAQKIIAITGNIGSGKSTVMGMLENRGYKTVSADKCTEGAYKIAKPQLQTAFGDEILTNGEINRKKLGTIAFASPENLAKLNSIMHPVIFQMIFDTAKGEKVCFCEVPLLFESGMQNYFESVWIVTASTQNKIDRAATRDSVSKEEIEKRLSFQKTNAEKTEKVHIIIENNGDIANLETQLEKAIQNI